MVLFVKIILLVLTIHCKICNDFPKNLHVWVANKTALTNQSKTIMITSAFRFYLHRFFNTTKYVNHLSKIWNNNLSQSLEHDTEHFEQLF